MKSSMVKLEALDPGLLPQGRQMQNTVSFSDRGRKQPLWWGKSMGKYSSPKAPATRHTFCRNEGLSSHSLYLLVVTYTSVSLGWIARMLHKPESPDAHTRVQTPLHVPEKSPREELVLLKSSFFLVLSPSRSQHPGSGRRSKPPETAGWCLRPQSFKQLPPTTSSWQGHMGQVHLAPILFLMRGHLPHQGTISGL